MGGKCPVRSLSTSCESTRNTASYPEVAEKALSVSRNADTTELDKDISSLTISENLPPEFFRFIEGVIIERFNDQRENNYQFAVVLLTPHELISIRKTKIQPLEHKELNQDRYTDSKLPFFPPGSEVFSNYIVARPHERKHAEEILLDNFAVLWKKFNEYYTEVEENCGKPRYIILYSWLMPCSTCVKAIIDTLSHYNSARVIVAYTLDWFLEQNNERNRAVLKSKGITVQKVPYNKFLQRKKPPITTQPRPMWQNRHDDQTTNFPHLPLTHSTTSLQTQYPVQPHAQLHHSHQQNSHNVASATHNNYYTGMTPNPHGMYGNPHTYRDFPPRFPPPATSQQPTNNSFQNSPHFYGQRF